MNIKPRIEGLGIAPHQVIHFNKRIHLVSWTASEDERRSKSGELRSEVGRLWYLKPSMDTDRG